ncbi:YdcF family protein [bacterium]|nr:YdcF family protein [bacterium]
MKRGFWYGAVAASLLWLAAILAPISAPRTVGRAIHAFLDISDGKLPEHSDFILVPSGSMLYRLPFAIRLLRENRGDTLVLTVTEPPNWRQSQETGENSEIPELSTVQQVLLATGVGDSEVVFLGKSRSTREDVKLFTDFLDSRPGWTAVVVSDGCHLRRLRMVFDNVRPGPAAGISYAASTKFDDLLDRSTEPSDVYQFVFKELIKYLFYVTGRA